MKAWASSVGPGEKSVFDIFHKGYMFKYFYWLEYKIFISIINFKCLSTLPTILTKIILNQSL